MKTRIIEASNGFNWGKFLIGQFDAREWSLRSSLPGNDSDVPLMRQVGWGRQHLLVVDMQTGEGVVHRPGGSAKADLDKHAVWVCPLHEPFLAWLYNQDLHDINALPSYVELPDAPSAVYGYRRPGPEVATR